MRQSESVRVYSGLDVWSDFGGAFPWKSRLVDVGVGMRQAVVDEGPRDAKLTFVLLHGNPTWGYLWRAFIARLSSRYRVIVPDHIGFGRSDKPRDPRSYTLAGHVDHLGAVLDALDARNVVPVMQDWGGPIGCGWAVRNPARVRGLVVLNTWAFVREPKLRLPFLFRWLVLGRGGWKRCVRNNLFVELLLPKGTTRGLTDAELAPYRAPFPTPDDRVGIARFPQLIPQTKNLFHESWATMAEIEDGLVRLREKQALIVWALRDPAFKKPQLERWKRVFLHVDGPHLLENAGHYLQEDAPDGILEHVERWAKERL
jgi:haloalkane dehalogenase